MVLTTCMLFVSVMAGSPERPVVLRAVDFGVVADDGKDDTRAFQAAVDACVRRKAQRLVLPKGQLDFFEGGNPDHPGVSVVVDGASDLVIQGPGTLCMFHGTTSCFRLSHCTQVRIEGLTIDFARPPFSAGRILEAEPGRFDVRVFDEFPVDSAVGVEAIMEYDPATRLPRSHGLDLYYGVERTELVGDQTLRMHLKNDVRAEVGAWAHLRHKVYGCCGFWLAECKDTTLSNITIYTVPGMGVVGQRSDNITLDRFRVRVKPGTGRLMSTTADATHFKACAGTITMKDCVFEGMGDDAGNIGGLYLVVREKVDARTIVGQHNLKMPVDLRAGEVVEFAGRSTLLPYAERTVATVEKLSDDNSYRITFTEPLVEQVGIDDVMGNASRVAAVRISNCRVGNNRARGFLIQTRDAVVENCRFENCTSGGVWVMCEIVHFFESIGPRNVIVRNNTFINCNYGGPIGEGVLSVFAYLADFKYPSTPGVQRNIVIENNTVRGSDNCGLFVAGVDGLIVRNNTFEQCCRNPTREQGNSVIYVMGSRDVELTDNIAPPGRQGKHVRNVYDEGPGNERETFRVKGNQGW